MALIDPLSDMIARIHNAQMRKKPKVSTPGSRLRARQIELGAAGQIVGVQQASRQPGFHRVGGVASRGLLDLHIDRQPVTNQRRPKCRALIGGSAEAIEVERRGDAGNHHHCAVQRSRVAESGERAEHAVASDHRDLDVLSLRKFHDKRDHTPVGQVGALERFTHLDQHAFLDQIHGSQVRTDQFEIIRGERRQESVG